MSPLHLLCQKCTSIISALCGREGVENGEKPAGKAGLENMRSPRIKEVHLISFLFAIFFFVPFSERRSVECGGKTLPDSKSFRMGGLSFFFFVFCGHS